MWERVDEVLHEYSLTTLAMAAARKWVRQMGDPRNKHLDRLREWMLLRLNGQQRAKPKSPWQARSASFV